MKQEVRLKPFLYTGCEELSEKFHKLKTSRDVAKLLEVPYSYLIYYIYKISENRRYTSFKIPKKTGGYRKIYTPHHSLSIIQRKLSQVFYAVYQPKPSVHGFAVQRSIITNAKVHTRKKFILNIDLTDFFESINFGRVRGLFIAKPYGINQKAATTIAQICCFKNFLPQGAPTSPIVSNLVCAKLDRDLQAFAKENKLFYTRYADDITFSINRTELPDSLIANYRAGFSQVVLGNEIRSLIEKNGFKINNDKVRLAHETQRQEVTGLIVNKFVNVNRKYIRNLYATLHAWEKYGLEDATKVYKAKYAKVAVSPHKETPNFLDSLRGKIEFVGSVRGKSDPIYQKLRSKFNELNKSEKEKPNQDD